jgi:hypothetical protein
MSQIQSTDRLAAELSSTGEPSLVVCFTVLASIAFLPATVFYLLPVSSPATGVALASIGVFLLSLAGLVVTPRWLRMAPWSLAIGLVIAALAAHLLFAAFQHQVDVVRALQSAVLLILVLLVVPLVTDMFERQEQVLARAASLICVLFVIFGILGVLRIQPPGSSIALSLEKSVFPFVEPSHYALAFTPFLIHACVSQRGWRRYLWLVTAFVLAYLLKSLSLVVGATVAAFICLPWIQIGLGGAIIFAITQLVSIDYFTERLDFELSSANISTLVYRQGWELMADAMYRTNWWGVGFQQLGYAPFNSPTSDLLYRILHSDSNLMDGGFTAAKMISELGLIGVAILAFYLWAAFWTARFLRASALRAGQSTSPALLFVCAMICGTALEMFVRGEGYFSGSLFLAEASALFVWHARRRNIGSIQQR